MKAFQFLPAALFKLKCADGQRHNTYMQRPKQFGWVMTQDTKHIEEVANHLLAPKSKHRAFTKVNALQPADEKLNGFLQR